MEMPPNHTPPSQSTSPAALLCPKSPTSSPQTEPFAQTDKPAEPPRPPLALTLPSTDAQPSSTPILTHHNAPLDDSANEEIFRTPVTTPTPFTPVQKQPARDKQPLRQLMTYARSRLGKTESKDLVRNLSNEFNLREKSKEPSKSRKPSSKKPTLKLSVKPGSIIFCDLCDNCSTVLKDTFLNTKQKKIYKQMRKIDINFSLSRKRIHLVIDENTVPASATVESRWNLRVAGGPVPKSPVPNFWAPGAQFLGIRCPKYLEIFLEKKNLFFFIFLLGNSTFAQVRVGPRTQRRFLKELREKDDRG
jgi:hypothetical protein